jgi:hypothetical protein
MPDLGQAQTGSLNSTPRQVKITSSANSATVFKNMGNNHNVPFMWAATATVASGTTSVTVASGVKFYDMDLAAYASVTATPTTNAGSDHWVAFDTEANTIEIKMASVKTDADVDFNLQFMLGPKIDVSTLSTRGTGAPSQSYP